MFDYNKRLEDATDWLEYFRKNLHVGVELELENDNVCRENPCDDCDEGDGDCDQCEYGGGGNHSDNISGDLKRDFGVPMTEYHSYINCNDCNLKDICDFKGGNKAVACHSLFRDNLVVAIQDDSSVRHGSEFLLHTGNMSTKEFIKRLPIHKLSSLGYHAGNSGSIHTHLIVPYFKKKIPFVIMENLWNLHRWFHLGIAYLTGTTAGRCLRTTGYGRFDSYWMELEKEIKNPRRAGMNIGLCIFDDKREFCLNLNVEIRTFNNSMNLRHIALCRFISNLLMLRATEISEYGSMVFRSGTKVWKQRKSIIKNYLNGDRRSITHTEIGIMKDCAEELYVELEHLMSDVEKGIFKEFIHEPIWLKRDKIRYIKKMKSTISEFDKALLCLVKTKGISGVGTRDKYYSRIARVLQSKPSYVRTRLNKIGAEWNSEIGAYVIR